LGRQVDQETCERVVDRGLSQIRGVIYSLFNEQPEVQGKQSEEQGNRKLYHFLCDLSDRRQNMSTLFEHAFDHQAEDDVDPHFWFSGGYYAATGGGHLNQGFIEGLLEKLGNERTKFADSRDRLVRISRRRFWARVLTLAAVVLLIANIALIWNWLNKTKPQSEREQSFDIRSDK
jgi:hypothetical protein